MSLTEATPTLNAEDETLTLSFPNHLTPGETTITIAYTGTLNDQMRGFYRSKYTSPACPEEERYAAVTQFEAADARRALPCWDEPAHKATFDVVLVIPKDRVGLSNMVRGRGDCRFFNHPVELLVVPARS